MKLKRMLSIFISVFAMLAIFMVPTNAFAATLGTPLTSPEAGWQRIDDTNSKIVYEGNWKTDTKDVYRAHLWGGSLQHCSTGEGESSIKFKFYGTKIRLIGAIYENKCKENIITIDDVTYTFSEYTSMPIKNNNYSPFFQSLVYEKTGLDLGVHTVVIKPDIKMTTSQNLAFDAIDIDSDGYLFDYYQPQNLKAVPGDKQVTLTWSPVDGAIGYHVYRSTKPGDTNPVVVTGSAITNSNYIDTGLENGKTYYYTVTAIVGGKESSKSQEVFAMPNGSSVIAGDRAILLISFISGKEKEYDLSADEIDKFIAWYDTKSDGGGKAYFKMPKYSNVKPFISRNEYIKFESIECFEIKDYIE